MARKDPGFGKVQNNYYDEDDELYKQERPKPVRAAFVYVNSPIAKKYRDGTGEDKGMCLSMHQPWASLLVYGIKKHEERTWQTEHRGRLWIHAAAHQPAPHDIEMVENFYKGRGATRFPTHYPTSVLLGSVEVTDCLTSADYREKIPEKDQESESDVVFICEQPQLLVVPLKMDGKHKIFHLEKRIWNSAKTQASM
eukprot:NODE_3033_length_951_cov_70.496359_g3013_i0.p1 GENE.NODE_3033_length_951_cov_70.496359_g3013_i0~~NODE_3033_length_951_cov_70.496359_g3013_i0.p1  ORF type:complete len:196 (+),score=46.68 NODE_3033_length_951_cov_70.496359_g3013_i0:337-924(+)